MKRFWTYIFIALFVGLLTTSCIEELDMPQSVTTDDTETILVPRVTSFANQYVTKSAYGTKETTITSLAVLVFNSDGNLVFLQENSNLDGASPVTLNKSRLNLASATVVMFANMSIDNIKNSENKSIRENKSTLTLTGLEGYTYHIPENQTFITDITSNFAGFPMVGVKGVDLTPTSTQQGQIEVSLKILFAKISLEIAVENGTENTLNPTQFTISSATITNLATATPLAMPAETGEKPKDFLGNEKNEEPLESADYTDETFVDTSSENKTKTITSTSKTVSAGSTSTNAKYTFYIAENRYNHGGTTDVYPSDSWLTSDLYDSYKQQYKPKLAEKTGGEGLPTYITLTGVYKDYRSTEWNVTYKVYLGKNNYDNFQIDRNSEYINTITIKGIRNNSDYGESDVWIDHRVDVELGNNQGADDCVTITRETLIDSHIEVRPLRINLTESDYVAAAIYLPTYPLDKDGRIIYDAETQPTSWGQIAEIAGGSNENWIAIENNNGSISRGKLYCASGKRKYFTTSLIEELHLQNDSEDHGIKVDQQGNRYLALSNNDCVWIYFDENLFSRRRARISIVFYKEK